MNLKHPNRYGVMAMVSNEDYKKFDKYRQILTSDTKFFMEKEFINGIAPQHVSLCYFSYENKYSEPKVESFVPRIKQILKKPISLQVKGLKGWWELGWTHPVVCWNIINLDEINKIHEQIIQSLKLEVEHFNDKGLTFDPHIGVAYMPDADEDILRPIIKKTQLDEIETITLNSIYIYFPSGPREIISLKNKD